MRIKGVNFSFRKLVCLFLYYGFATYLPDSYSFFFGKTSNKVRIYLCKRIFGKCGKIQTINRKVSFGTGRNIEIGDGNRKATKRKRRTKKY